MTRGVFTYRYPRPAVTVDVAVFSVRDQRLELLLVKRANEPFAGQWALPGGFVGIDEPLDVAARRELAEETALEPARMEQFHTFGEPHRDPRERVISVAFVACVNADDSAVKSGSDAAKVAWFDCDDLPTLAFDHATIVEHARTFLEKW